MSGTWNALAHQPTFNTGTMLLLTDGRVMVHEAGTAHWHALTPDSSGSYVNGAWSTLQDMAFWRRYFVSGILKDGRVFLCGGEQSGDVGDTNKGEIYDPTTDSWHTIALPPWSQVGDASCCVLPDGRVLIGSLGTSACLIYDPGSDAWVAAGSKAIRSNEETWVLMPDNTIVAPQCWSPYQSEKYIIATNTWKNEGALPVSLIDTVMQEIGPGMLLYDGRAIFFGAANSSGHGKTALYTAPGLATGTGAWAAGPDIPNVGGKVIVSNDCPAALLPNGKVLFTGAQYTYNNWGSPVLFFEFEPTTNTIAQAPTPVNNATYPYAPYPGLYWSRLMLLPTGQVLFSASSSNVQCYTPDGGPHAGWRPTITSVTPHSTLFGVDYYVLQGTQLNGLSQANIYGDDCYPATNYPLVRLTNTSTHAVHYARTYDMSTMGVATGPSLQSARFTVGGLPDGSYDLCVVANGIASLCVNFNYIRPRKPDFLDKREKREFEILGKIIYEGDPFNWRDWGVDPELGELKMQVKLLQNSVQRLTSLIQTKELPQVGKDVAKLANQSEAAAAPRRRAAKKSSKPKE